MANKSELVFSLNRTRTAVNIRIVDDGVDTETWFIEAPELDQHIRQLANYRAQLVEGVAPDLEPGALVTDAVLDPAFRVSSRSPDEFVAAYRHPGLGWLSFALTPKRAEALARQLEDWLKPHANR